MIAPLRTPVHVPAPGEVRIFGVDTGFANIGLAVVEGFAGSDGLRALHVEVLRTQKATKKARRNLRVSTDDARRLEEIFDHVKALVPRFHPLGFAIEVYSPNPTQRGVGAWKTAMVYALIFGLARGCGLPVFSYLPADIKKPFGGRLSASKEAVAEALIDQVQDFESCFSPIPDTLKEHASDACAHAVLGVQEMLRMRQLMGVQ